MFGSFLVVCVIGRRQPQSRYTHFCGGACAHGSQRGFSFVCSFPIYSLPVTRKIGSGACVHLRKDEDVVVLAAPTHAPHARSTPDFLAFSYRTRRVESQKVERRALRRPQVLDKGKRQRRPPPTSTQLPKIRRQPTRQRRTLYTPNLSI